MSKVNKKWASMDDDWTSQDTIWLLKAVSFGGGILVAIGGGILIYARYIV